MKKGYKLNKHFAKILQPPEKDIPKLNQPNIYKSFVGLPLAVALSSIAIKEKFTINYRRFVTPPQFL